jgi:NitT/TauT family transport system ATP-binding protein
VFDRHGVGPQADVPDRRAGTAPFVRRSSHHSGPGDSEAKDQFMTYTATAPQSTDVRESVPTCPIEVEDLCVTFAGSSRRRHRRAASLALDHVSFRVEPGEFVAIVGPSGCGKSTLLKAIAGLLSPSRGTVRLGDGTTEPRVGFVFQSDGLLPWRTAVENVELAIRLAGLDRKSAGSVALDLMSNLGLADAANKYPGQLSGGMRKRVALARAIAHRPAVFLMDEPFSALDAQTRIRVGNFCLDIFGKMRQSVIFVTHDIDEAVALADRVLVLSRGPGRLIADFTIDLPRPRDYHATRYVPDFAGIQQQVWDALRTGEADDDGE